MKTLFNFVDRMLGIEKLFTSNEAWGKLGALGSRDNAIEDPNVMASAATIAPTYRITRVSGVVAIANITVPYTGFQGTITLIPTGLWTWTAAGNIGLAGNAAVGKAVNFTYSQGAGKWYPDIIA